MSQTVQLGNQTEGSEMVTREAAVRQGGNGGELARTSGPRPDSADRIHPGARALSSLFEFAALTFSLLFHSYLAIHSRAFDTDADSTGWGRCF